MYGNVQYFRSIPLGLRRPGSDELAWRPILARPPIRARFRCARHKSEHQEITPRGSNSRPSYGR
jgi:hypothetical protein